MPNVLKSKISDFMRGRRNIRLRQLIASISKRKVGIQILDLGGTIRYWQHVGFDFLRDMHAHITLVNLHAAELGDFAAHADLFRAIAGDACSLPEFTAGQFDLVHSNSVIEHVVTWENMKRIASETRRVGTAYYVQTPYFWFPIDPHYYKVPGFHWLPRPLRARLLENFSIAHVGKATDLDHAFHMVDDARILDGRQFRFLFPDATIHYERILGVPKSMIAMREMP